MKATHKISAVRLETSNDALDVLEYLAAALRMDGQEGRAKQVDVGIEEIRFLRLALEREKSTRR